MEVLEPNWNAPKPTWDEANAMATNIDLVKVVLPTHPFDEFVESLNKSHTNGGVQLAAFDVGPDPVFDWFASRNRLWEFDVMDALLVRPTIRQALPELKIPDSFAESAGFGMASAFTLDGALADALFRGGAYHQQKGDGKKEKELAMAVCDAMFGLRFGEVYRYTSSAMWTPYFYGIDRRLRRLWLIAITDTD